MSNPERLNAARVTVRALARLHLGFLDLNGGLGRRFGSIGLALDGLGTTLTVQSAPQMRVEGLDAERAQNHIATMRRSLGIGGNYRVTIEAIVRPHAGLGSGTQMALAVAAALRRLNGLPLDPAGDAVRLGRGQRSGIGIAAFQVGGLVLDGGRSAATQAPPLISRIAFPKDWRAIVLLDPTRQGFHGAPETAAFAQLPEFPGEKAAHLCRLVLMRVLPAAAEHDIAAFGSGIGELQAAIGDYFAPAQGARFTSPDVGAVLAYLDALGAHGIGQSSWGPTGFAFAATLQEAERLAALARAHQSGRALDIRVCAALNRGAEITAE
jgi:beta-ribofuranosylaminobenzene 5'-phosphate synthase